MNRAHVKLLGVMSSEHHSVDHQREASVREAACRCDPGKMY